jgi:hypothetical protein
VGLQTPCGPIIHVSNYQVRTVKRTLNAHLRLANVSTCPFFFRAVSCQSFNLCQDKYFLAKILSPKLHLFSSDNCPGLLSAFISQVSTMNLNSRMSSQVSVTNSNSRSFPGDTCQAAFNLVSKFFNSSLNFFSHNSRMSSR